MIYKGTTPTHSFKLPVSKEAVDEVRVTYAQGAKVVLVKNTGNCSVTDDVVSVTLTQEETFLFKANVEVSIQVRVLTTDGHAFSSDTVSVGVYKCLDGEVLVDADGD